VTTGGDLGRAYAFLARGDMGGTRSEASPFGRAVYTDETPLRYDGNYLWVDRAAEPEELAAEARRLERRMIFVPDSTLGDRLAPWFEQHGWRIDRHLLMAQLRTPERTADLSLVREVEEKALRAPRAILLENEPWARPEVVEQIFHAKVLLVERVETHFFGIEVGGGIVSWSELYLDEGDAQIEDVGTLEEHRGRGYASAVVLAAAERARAEGASFVFLVADAEDWPKELYRRLGFDELGRYTKFIGPST
jgi:ribosomal protein S18 acetylase RimI-like enzyme